MSRDELGRAIARAGELGIAIANWQGTPRDSRFTLDAAEFEKFVAPSRASTRIRRDVMKGEIKIVKTRAERLEPGDVYRYHPNPVSDAWSRWFQVDEVSPLREGAGKPVRRIVVHTVGASRQTLDKLDVVEVQVDVARQQPQQTRIDDDDEHGYLQRDDGTWMPVGRPR